MMSEATARAFAPVVLRLGLSVLFLWFGLSQLAEPSLWVGWVPLWATGLTGFQPETVVLLNGALEVVGGVLLSLGLLVRLTALVLAAHLFVITYGIGPTEIGFRDFALACATLALALGGPDFLSLGKKRWL